MKIFHLPDLGEGLAEAEIREWYVKVNDEVKVDQPLVSMETAKAIVDVPSPYAGKILELHGKANAIVKTGAPLITFDILEEIKDGGSIVGKLDTLDAKWEEQEATIGINKNRSSSAKAMPAARVLAKEYGVDISKIIGTGSQGLITVADIKDAASKNTTTREWGAGVEPLHGVRRVMAQAMTHSHHDIVPVTIFDDADITHLIKDQDLTVLLLHAIAAACKLEPALNSWFDGSQLERKLCAEVNIGLAVDAPEGLFVPVIRNVESRQSTSLRQQINTYKELVRERSLTPADMQGATITFSNFGSIAGRYATPIIVPPTVSILAAGRCRVVPVVRDNNINIGRTIPLSLTFDHRAVTGGEASRFLGAVINHLEK